MKNQSELVTLKNQLKDSQDTIQKIKGESTDQLVQLDTLKNVNKIQVAKLQRQETRIVDLQEKSVQLALDLSEASKSINSSIQGGDSYPRFFYFKHPTQKDIVRVCIMVVGDYPLYDASIGHHYVGFPMKEGSLSSVEAEEFFSKWNSAPKLQGGTFNPTGGVTQIGEIKMDPNKKESSYQIDVWARNGQYMQLTKIRRKPNGTWERYFSELKRVENGKSETIESYNKE